MTDQEKKPDPDKQRPATAENAAPLTGPGGVVLEQYELLEKLSTSRTGSIFKARHRVMGRLAAVKFLAAEAAAAAQMTERFQRAVKILSQLEHPNLVRAYEAGQQGGSQYLVMEYLDGQDLRARVKQRGPLAVNDAVAYCLQAAKGLAFLHSQGVYHRNIKPANLVITRDGLLKIVGLGLVHVEAGGAVAEAGVDDDLTRRGQILGTCEYMSPEQAADSRHVDPRADVYSLGCTLYHLLTGRAPFSGKSPPLLILAHRQQPIPSLRKERPDVPEELDCIFRKMLAKRVEDRYVSMQELAAALEACPTAPPAEETTGERIQNLLGLGGGKQRPENDAAAKPGAKPAKRKKPGRPAWMIPVLAAAGVAAIVAIVAMIYLPSKPTSVTDPEHTDLPKKNDDKKSVKLKKPVPVLSIDWPDGERFGAELFVNDERKDVPAKGPIVIPIPLSKEPYYFRLLRRGFQPITFFRGSQGDDQGYAVQWEPVVPGMDWGQDFEAAKRTAGSEHKSVLIFFDASDSKQSGFISSRFREAVTKHKEFRQRADAAYVCIYIDNPQGAEAQGKVANVGRNRELTEKFHVAVFPTVVVTDEGGRPFGVLEDYKINEFNAFLELVNKWQDDRKTLFELLDKAKAMPADRADADLVARVCDFLERNKLDRFYRDTIKDLAARVPKEENRPVPREMIEKWAQDFQRASPNRDELKKVVAGFDQWKKSRTFQDPDLAARLHWFAAVLLARVELREEAARKCKEGLALNPRDPLVRSLLEQLDQYFSGKGDGFLVGTGTGFCVARGNYVLTNHHVIHGAKKIMLRLNGEKELYPARLIAGDESGDMALLKIDLPAGRQLVPIPLARSGVKIGEDVCALGFPGVLRQSVTLTLTKGVVSTVPAPDDEAGFIATDCKVNPGNSGGPLCSSSGGVAGMVTRKSGITSLQDSYGLVIPAGRLRKFLLENLPRESRKLPSELARATNFKLSNMAEIVAPSVVHIENIQ